MSQEAKLILAEMLQILQVVSATTAALEEAAQSPTHTRSQLTQFQLAEMRDRAAKQQQDRFIGLAERIRDLTHT